jgi:hypothetical protein
MMEVVQVAVCSQVNTKHINTVWAEQTVLELVHCWCIAQTVGFKRLRITMKILNYDSLSSGRERSGTYKNTVNC